MPVLYHIVLIHISHIRSFYLCSSKRLHRYVLFPRKRFQTVGPLPPDTALEAIVIRHVVSHHSVSLANWQCFFRGLSGTGFVCGPALKKPEVPLSVTPFMPDPAADRSRAVKRTDHSRDARCPFVITIVAQSKAIDNSAALSFSRIRNRGSSLETTKSSPRQIERAGGDRCFPPEGTRGISTVIPAILRETFTSPPFSLF